MHSDLWGPTLSQVQEAEGQRLWGQMLSRNRKSMCWFGLRSERQKRWWRKTCQSPQQPRDTHTSGFMNGCASCCLFPAVDTSGSTRHPSVAGTRDGVGCCGLGMQPRKGLKQGTAVRSPGAYRKAGCPGGRPHTLQASGCRPSLVPRHGLFPPHHRPRWPGYWALFSVVLYDRDSGHDDCAAPFPLFQAVSPIENLVSYVLSAP